MCFFSYLFQLLIFSLFILSIIPFIPLFLCHIFSPGKCRIWSLLLTISFADFYSSMLLFCFPSCIETECVCPSASPSSFSEISDNWWKQELEVWRNISTFVLCAWPPSVIAQEKTRNRSDSNTEDAISMSTVFHKYSFPLTTWCFSTYSGFHLWCDVEDRW